MSSSTTATFTAHVAAVWARWARSQGTASVASNAERENQFRLLAAALIAPLDASTCQSIWTSDVAAASTSLWAQLTPLAARVAEDPARVHFVFVVLAELVDGLALAVETSSSNDNDDAVVTRAMWVTETLLLPILRSQAYVRLHSIALDLVARLLPARGVVDLLRERVAAALLPPSSEPNATNHGQDDDDAAAASEDSDDTSYDALCRVYQLVLLRGASPGTGAEDPRHHAICLRAIAGFARHPRFLRAVSVHLFPARLESGPAAVTELLEAILATWEAAAPTLTRISSASAGRRAGRVAVGSHPGSQLANLLYLLCLLLPRDPTMIRAQGLQRLIAFALTHQDPLLRKQALHLLKIAFSHYDLATTTMTMTTTTSAKATNKAKSKAQTAGPPPSELETWRSFLLASEVIQLHHEPHLIEQVWPHVDQLLQQRLFADDEITTETTWPVRFTFAWVQSLLLRVFRHENPIVRRMFLSNFMQRCVDEFAARTATPTAITAVAPGAFLADPLFETFVFVRLLRACNDPLMYKSSRKEPFQRLLTEFLVQYLGVRLAGALPAATSLALINTYAHAACDAVFGPGTDVHSPEAIISMLQVFESPVLQSSVVTIAATAPGASGLDAAALDKVRFVLEVYVLRSFPLSMRTALLRSLEHMLTGGFMARHGHPLNVLAKILIVFPTAHLTRDAHAALGRLNAWLAREDGGPVTAPSFLSVLGEGLDAFMAEGEGEGRGVNDQVVPTTTTSPQGLTAEELARLLILATMQQTPTGLVFQQPLATLVGDLRTLSGAQRRRLLVVLGCVEQELAALGANPFTGVGLESAPARGVLRFAPLDFYGEALTGLFAEALAAISAWLDGALARRHEKPLSVGDAFAEDGMLPEQAALGAMATVATQLATYHMEELGRLELVEGLGGLCQRLEAFLSAATTDGVGDLDVRQVLQDQTIALRILAIVSAQPRVLDAIDEAFAPSSVLPLALGCRASRHGANSSRQVSDTLFVFAASKWQLIHHTLAASSYVPTPLLRAVLDAAVDGLYSVGADATMLTDMVHVLALALGRLGSVLLESGEDSLAQGTARLDEIFQEIWCAYGHAKPKPDALSRAVVYCLFQPAFLRRRELVEGPGALLKRWYRTLVAYGEVHRPHVLFHLACRLTQVWRGLPRAAWFFADEIAELLLYKEPVIADKQKSPSVPDQTQPLIEASHSDPTTASSSSSTRGLSVKDRFVRFVVLSFLDELCLDDDDDDDRSANADERRLLDAVLGQLVDMNFADDWQRQHMLNSDGFGKKLRCWQAMTVLCKHITRRNLPSLGPRFWRAFAATQLPIVRFYMEVVAMRLCLRFPEASIHGHVLPLLGDFNLTPQVGASLLLVAGFVVHHHLAAGTLEDEFAYARTLLAAQIPWLNASHGHTRVLVQFLLGQLLPRYLHHLEAAASAGAGAGAGETELIIFQQLARFLSENKECKRMFRRQRKQFESFQPEFQCTMLGLLSSAHINEFHELFPDEDGVSLSAQLKDTMNVLYEQFQREHFADELAARAATESRNQRAQAETDAAAAGSSSITVQRKIDTSAILLDESLLPAAMKEREAAVALNVCQKPRQPVIMCATLVDKIPNLAGLARTCEIFNAHELVVPNLRACDDEAFQTISVTANKWIPMTEVREDALVAALMEWKREGYTIVAVEQTASSSCLSEFTFPEKIVIVLGKEKEGIPVAVLQCVDVCVEIPQFGLIRSLNVHVSGAILLWEYTQQRLVRALAPSTTA